MQLAAHQLQRPLDADHAGLQVHVGPAQREQLTPARTGRQAERDEDLKRRTLGRRGAAAPADGEPAFYAVVVWRDQAVHAAASLAKGSRVVVVGRLVQRSWQADDGSARSVVEVVADELG